MHATTYNSLCPHTAGSDYSESVGIEFTFDSAITEVNVSIPIIGDNIFELTKLFCASLAFSGAPPLRVVLTPDSAQVTILDDDGQCHKFNNTCIYHMQYIIFVCFLLF